MELLSQPSENPQRDTPLPTCIACGHFSDFGRGPRTIWTHPLRTMARLTGTQKCKQQRTKWHRTLETVFDASPGKQEGLLDYLTNFKGKTTQLLQSTYRKQTSSATRNSRERRVSSRPSDTSPALSALWDVYTKTMRTQIWQTKFGQHHVLVSKVGCGGQETSEWGGLLRERAQETWGREWGRPRTVGARTGGPSGGARRVGGPKAGQNFAFFFPLPLPCSLLFYLSGGLLVVYSQVVRRRQQWKCREITGSPTPVDVVQLRLQDTHHSNLSKRSLVTP